MSCGVLVLAACANAPKQIALDYGPVQIGCSWRLEESAESLESVSQRTWSPNLRLGIPFWAQAQYEENADRSLGVEDAGSRVNGLSLAILADFSEETNGLEIAPLTFANVNGLSLALLAEANTQVKGIVVAPIAFLSSRLDGLSLALLNVVDDGRSVQFGLINGHGVFSSRPDSHGVAQIGISNNSWCTETNVQIGALNYCEGSPYLQVGLVNRAMCDSDHVEERHFALQVGLWNSNGRWSFPLVNVSW